MPDRPCPHISAVDVWPIFQRAGIGGVLCPWKRPFDAAGGYVARAANPPCDERLRQWRRMTSRSMLLSFNDIIDCLGWRDVQRIDSDAVRAVVRGLLGLDFPEEGWCPMQDNGDRQWLWRV